MSEDRASSQAATNRVRNTAANSRVGMAPPPDRASEGGRRGTAIQTTPAGTRPAHTDSVVMQVTRPRQGRGRMVWTCARWPRLPELRSPPRASAAAPRSMRLPPPPAPVATRETSTTVSLHGKPLVLHLAAPAVPASAPPAALVLYASGDGGWFGAAVQMFRVLAAAGHAGGRPQLARLPQDRAAGPGPAEPEQLRLDYARHPRWRAPGARAAARDAPRS